MSPARRKIYGPSFHGGSSGISRSSTATTATSDSSSSSASTAISDVAKEVQTVTNRYVKEEKLMEYLAATYKPGEYSCAVRGIGFRSRNLTGE